MADSMKQLAANIRRYRKARALTQSQLAEKLFVTPQNVSKWELGLALPDVSNLCKISQILEVSTDDLLGLSEKEHRPECRIAIDGGGTKTEFLLFTPDGTILEQLVLPASNPNSCGMETTLAVLQQGIDQLLALEDSVTRVYAGIAGCGLRKNRKAVLDFFAKKYPVLTADVQSDIGNVIASVTDEEDCLAVICGTGSVIYAKTGDELHRMGGWGYLFDRGGNGYTLGRDAIRAALAAQDRSGPPTRLLSLTEQKVGGDLWDNLNRFYTANADQVASYASLVFDAAEQKDPVAEEILRTNRNELLDLIHQAAKLHPTCKKIILAGGILSHHPSFFTALQEGIAPDLVPILVQVPQVFGAAVCAVRDLSASTESFRQTLAQTYQKVRK